MTNDHDDRAPSEGFLARWSKRKQEAKRPDQDPAPPVADDAETPLADDCEPPFDLASLPDIETVDAATDITGFLRRGVPPELQRLALRRVWALDPAISGFIEVAENQYDFNTPGSIPGFGDFAPGTDLSAMVAHALGEGPVRLPEPEVVTEKPEAVATEIGPIPQVADETMAASTDPAPTVIPTMATSKPDGIGERPSRPRRHGGALPA